MYTQLLVQVIFIIITLTNYIKTGSSRSNQCPSWLVDSRCRLRCLSEHRLPVEPNQCLLPCDKDVTEISNCNQICKVSKSSTCCNTSCESVSKLVCDVDFITNNERIKCSPHDSKCHVDEESFVISQVIVSESWVTRGIQVRWKINETTCDCGQRASTIYAIQMRQLIGGLDDSGLDDWTVITTTMSRSLNLINVLTLGLTYKLRIVAVSSTAIRNVSVESRQFGLPKDIPVPSAPKNISSARSKFGVSSLTVHWDGPRRDDAFGQQSPIAVTDYMITVTKQTESVNSTVADVLLDVSDRACTAPTTTTTKSQHCTYKLVNIDPIAIYVIEIRAVIQLGGSQFMGDTAVLKVHPMFPKYPVPTTEPEVKVNDRPSDPATINDLMVGTPFYLNDSLRAFVTWHYSIVSGVLPVPIRRFLLHLNTVSCTSFAIDNDGTKGAPIAIPKGQRKSVSSIRRPQTFQVIYIDPNESKFELDQLYFECVYRVSVIAETVHKLRGPTAQTQFQTSSCYSPYPVTGAIPSNCPTQAPKNLACDVKTSKVNDLQLQCHWNFDVNSNLKIIRGFLIVATPYSHAENESSIIHRTINKVGRMEVSLHGLQPNVKYQVSVQAIGNDNRNDNRWLLGPPAQKQLHVANYYRSVYMSRTAPSESIKSMANNESTTFTMLIAYSLLLYLSS